MTALSPAKAPALSLSDRLSAIDANLKTSDLGSVVGGVESLRGLTKSQIFDVLTECQIAPAAARGAVANAILAHLIANMPGSPLAASKAATPAATAATTTEPAEHHHTSAAANNSNNVVLCCDCDEDTEPFAGGLLRFGRGGERQPMMTASEAEQFSDAELLLGALEKGTPLLRSSIIECAATFVFMVLHIGIVRTSVMIEKDFKWPAVVFISTAHVPLILCVILCSAPGGAGHFNPLMTMATLFTGHTSALRALCFIVAQFVGAVLASVLMRVAGGWTAAALDNSLIAACNNDGDASHGQMFLMEFLFSFCALFFAFGIALDPIQMRVLGGAVNAPMLLSIATGTVIFASAAMGTARYAPWPAFNAVACIGPAVALYGKANSTHWVYYIAELCAAFVHAFLFLGAPPHHEKQGFFVPLLLREKRKYKVD